MRIALVSPYSWTYPGGVTRHIEALAEQLLAAGHHVRVLAPFDPPDRLSARLHRGAAPQPREAPDYLIPLGRTIGDPGERRGLQPRVFPSAITALRRELAAGDFDVVHIHEPVAPPIGWDALLFDGAAARRDLPHLLARTRVTQRRRARVGRGAADATACTRGSPSPRPRPGPARASSAAATGSSRTASTVPAEHRRAARAAARRAADRVRRPGRRAQGPAAAAARLRGAARARRRRADDRRRRSPRRSSRCCSTSAASRVLGRVDDEEKTRVLRERRRALRAVARRRELRHGPHRGVRRRARRSSPATSPATATSSATASTACSSRAATRPRSPRRCATSRSTPERRRADGRGGRRARAALRLAARRRARWCDVYEQAIAAPRAATRPRHAPRARRLGASRSADRRPPEVPRARLASLEPEPAGGRSRARDAARSRAAPALAVAAVGGLLLDGARARSAIGVDRIGDEPAALQPAVGARRARRDVRLDGAARASLARDPARRAAATAGHAAATPSRAPSSAC